MHQYELMVILDPGVEERTVSPNLEKFLNVVRNGGGTVENIDIWGRRRLSYEINKKTEGIYAVINMTASSAVVLELDRQLRLSEAVMRTKLLRADEAVVNITPVAVEGEAEAPKAKKPAAKPATKPATKPAAKSANESAE